MQIKRLLSLGRITDSTEVQIFEGQPTNLKQFLQRFRNINFRFSGCTRKRLQHKCAVDNFERGDHRYERDDESHRGLIQ